MHFVVALSLVLAPQAPTSQAERFEPVDVVAASGRFAARVRKADGQEHVDDVLARWMLTVEARDRDGRSSVFWSSVVQHRAGARRHFLSDDGLALVEVDPSCERARDVVRVWHAGREPFAVDAGELVLERCTGTWLAAEHGASVVWFESPLGPVPQLLLALAQGGERRVDLASGAVFTTREWTSEPVAGPLIAEELRKHAADGYVRSATAPARAYFGEPIEVVVEGSHPTPGWHFAGFDARVELVEGVTSIALTPLSLAPPGDRPQAQVLRDFRCTATLGGLVPGRYEVRVLGRGDEPLAPLSLRVLPARPWVELELQGGRSVRVYPSGVVAAELPRDERRVRTLDAAERELFESRYRQLPERAAPQVSTPVEAYCLRWTVEGKHVELRGDATTLPASALGFVELLAAEAR